MVTFDEAEHVKIQYHVVPTYPITNVDKFLFSKLYLLEYTE